MDNNTTIIVWALVFCTLNAAAWPLYKLADYRQGRKFVLAGLLALIAFPAAFVGTNLWYAQKLLGRGETIVWSLNDLTERSGKNAQAAGTQYGTAWFCAATDETHVSMVSMADSATVLAHELAHALDHRLGEAGGLAWFSDYKLENYHSSLLDEQTGGYSAVDRQELLACLYEQWVTSTPADFEAAYGKQAVEAMRSLENGLSDEDRAAMEAYRTDF